MPEPLNNLKDYVDRVVRLHEERDQLNADIKEVYEEAKEAGYVPARLREVVREYRLDEETRNDRYTVLAAYRRALGMLADLPLGEAAMERAAKPKPKRGPRRPRKSGGSGRTASEWLDEVVGEPAE